MAVPDDLAMDLHAAPEARSFCQPRENAAERELIRPYSCLNHAAPESPDLRARGLQVTSEHRVPSDNIAAPDFTENFRRFLPLPTPNEGHEERVHEELVRPEAETKNQRVYLLS